MPNEHHAPQFAPVRPASSDGGAASPPPAQPDRK